MTTFLVIVGVIAALVLYNQLIDKPLNAKAAQGAENLVCPHCHEKGCVTAKSGISSKGISGGKAAGAVATGGLSVFATGLAKNQRVRKLSCSNCRSEWDG